MRKKVSFRFIYYSTLFLLIFLTGRWIRPELYESFWQAWPLYHDALIGGGIAAFTLAFLGVYTILNRIVFVSLAVAQSSGLGIFLAWLIIHSSHTMIHTDLSHQSYLGFFFALIFGWLAALLFARLRQLRHISEGALIAVLYLISSGLFQLMANYIPEGQHSMNTLLFGNAVTVVTEDWIFMLMVAIGILLVHVSFRRELIYSSADSVFMVTRGLKAERWNIVLYALLSIGIAASLKILGSLACFTCLVFPGFISLKKAQSMFEAFSLASFLGLSIALLSFFYSHLFDWPAGASYVVIALVLLIFSSFESKAEKLILR